MKLNDKLEIWIDFLNGVILEQNIPIWTSEVEKKLNEIILFLGANRK